MMDSISDYTAYELMEVVTHKEACEMFLEMKSSVDDMDGQMERLVAYAKSLELEKTSLLSMLGK